jgi:structure-specific endonuclease subunit SLX1
MEKKYVCYLLVSEESNKTYIGITNHLSRRIRQHNGECSGGAKYTCQGRPWRIYGYVDGFGDDKSMVLKFEWRWKYLSRKEKGDTLERRMKALNKLMINGREYINLNYELNFVMIELNFVMIE